MIQRPKLKHVPVPNPLPINSGFLDPGYSVRETPRGIKVITIDFWAMPSRDRAWQTRMMALMGPKSFNREFGRDWLTADGRSFYPEFEDWEQDQIVIPGMIVRNLPIYRGWDFGFHHPACVFFQFDPIKHRVWVLAEFMPENIGTHDFRDVVLYLSGQLDRRELSPKAIDWVHRLEETGSGYPPTPWFPAGMPRQWIDYSGPEALQIKAIAASEDKAVTDKQVLEERGILLNPFSMSVKARETVMRSLLRPRPDGYPGIIFDPNCPILIAAIAGGIVYREGTKDHPYPDEPKKDGYWEHLHDALGYALVNAVPVVEQRARQVRTVITSRQQAIQEQVGGGGGEQDMGYYENKPQSRASHSRR